MSGKAKFVHWQEQYFDDIPAEPMFNVVANDKGLPNGSTVCASTLMTQYGISLPLFPSIDTWRLETAQKRRCFRCWAVVRGAPDLFRHRILVHHEDLGHMATNGMARNSAILIVLFVLGALFLPACNTLKRAIGDKPDPVSTPIRAPIVYSITGTWNGGYTTNAVSCNATFWVNPTGLGDPRFSGVFNDGATGCLDGRDISNFTGVMNGKDFTMHLISGDTTCPGTFDITGTYETDQNGNGTGISLTGVSGTNCRGTHTTMSGHFG